MLPRSFGEREASVEQVDSFRAKVAGNFKLKSISRYHFGNPSDFRIVIILNPLCPHSKDGTAKPE